MSGGRQKMKTQLSIKSIVAIGIGSALFFVLGRFVAIPSPVPNTTINIQYAVLGVLGTAVPLWTCCRAPYWINRPCAH